MAANFYTVHFSPFGRGPDRDARFVKEGFAWTAFVFGPFWAFYHRLWLPGVLLLLAIVALALASEIGLIDPAADAVFGVGLSALFAFEANDLRRAKLGRAGLAERGITSGRNLSEAELDWFRRHSPSRLLAESAER